MTTPLNIGIAGAGIGGLAAAAFLARAGHNVTVFDQFDRPTPVGSGLVVQPVGQMVLAALGVLDRAMGMGHVIERMIGTEAASGQKVLNITYAKANDTRFGLAMHRASLFDCVHFAALQAGARLVPATTITATENTPKGRFLLAAGDRLGPFDLVIDASGATSPLSPITLAPLEFGALWATVDTPAGITPEPILAQCYRKSATMVGILPVGTLPGSPTHKTAVFWSLKRADFARWQAAPFADWQAEASNLWPVFAPYAAALGDHSQMTMARYSHGTLRFPIGPRLAFIGDAAHATSPQLGQGANMALLDALALAEALRQLPLEQALPHYARTRRWHVWLYQLISHYLTPFYQSDSQILPLARDVLLAPISDIPPIRGILQRLVSGELISIGPLRHHHQRN